MTGLVLLAVTYPVLTSFVVGLLVVVATALTACVADRMSSQIEVRTGPGISPR